MPIDTDSAAVIARSHGLGLPDVQALSVLANSIEHAESLARLFSHPLEERSSEATQETKEPSR